MTHAAPAAITYLSAIEPALCVSDLDKQVAFYTTVLGFELVATNDVEPRLSTRTSISPAGYRIVRLRNGRGDLLKLVKPGHLDTSRARGHAVLERAGDTYLTFIVQDLAGVVANLASAGAAVTSDGTVEVRPGAHLLFARDPEGNHLEFVQKRADPA